MKEDFPGLVSSASGSGRVRDVVSRVGDRVPLGYQELRSIDFDFRHFLDTKHVSQYCNFWPPLISRGVAPHLRPQGISMSNV